MSIEIYECLKGQILLIGSQELLNVYTFVGLKQIDPV